MFLVYITAFEGICKTTKIWWIALMYCGLSAISGHNLYQLKTNHLWYTVVFLCYLPEELNGT